jgi:mono/diheme cytochrome c family protein
LDYSPGISVSPSQASLALGAALLLLATSGRTLELTSYSGAELYQRFCASCHGRSGLGDGPVASQLKVSVPDLTRIAQRHGGMFPTEDVRRIIDGRSVHMAHGTRTMPVWGYDFRAGSDTDSVAVDELVRRLVEYLRSIQIE